MGWVERFGDRLIFSTLSPSPLKQNLQTPQTKTNPKNLFSAHQNASAFFFFRDSASLESAVCAVVIACKQSHTLNCRLAANYMWILMATSDRLEIIRFCETPKDKGRIMSRLGLNDVMAESYLAILLAQSLIVQSNGKYVVTQKGQRYLSSSERTRKIITV